MEIKDIKALADKIYADIETSGIDGVTSLYAKEKTLSQELRHDPTYEYLKKMIISQLNIGSMLFTHKYSYSGFDAKPKYNNELDEINEQIATSHKLQFDDATLDSLFGNTLEIKSDEEYRNWNEFIFNNSHNDIKFDTIYFEEEFKFNYEKTKNPIKKFIQSFQYRKMLRGNQLEDKYISKVREMIRTGIRENPDEPIVANNKTRRAMDKGVSEYESIKDVEDIARMTLISLSTETDKPIDIETICNQFRMEMKNTTGLTRTGTEYRQRQVTIGSENGIKRGPVLQTIPYAEIPDAIKKLQEEYEQAYNTSQSQEEYIKQIAKICFDFMHIQPYEDGNKRTGICLFNSMLLSKGIVPPPINLMNDEEMTTAFYNAKNNDYYKLHYLVLRKYNEMKSTFRKMEGQEQSAVQKDIRQPDQGEMEKE